jgi:hypothetical protein
MLSPCNVSFGYRSMSNFLSRITDDALAIDMMRLLFERAFNSMLTYVNSFKGLCNNQVTFHSYEYKGRILKTTHVNYQYIHSNEYIGSIRLPKTVKYLEWISLGINKEASPCNLSPY